MKHYLNRVRWWWQRLTRGYGDDELWSLDYTIARFVLPRLRALRANKIGCPADFAPNWPDTMTGDDVQWQQAHAAWDVALGKMIAAFELVVDEMDGPWERLTLDEMKAGQAAKNEGLALFGKYFEALWE